MSFLCASKRRNKTGFAAVFFLFVFSLSSVVSAQTEDGVSSGEEKEPPYENEMEALIDFQRAKVLVQSGHFVEALPLLQKIVKTAPRSSVRFYLGRAYAGLGRCEDALAELLDLEDTLPNAVAIMRDEEVTRCLRYQFEGAINTGECSAAKRLLSGLEGLIPKVERDWRKESVDKCIVDRAHHSVRTNEMSSEADALMSEQEVWAWSLMTAFTVFSGVSVYYGVSYVESADKMKDFQSLYNVMDEASKLSPQGEMLKKKARQSQEAAGMEGTVTWVSGAFAAVSLGVGLSLLFSEPMEQTSRRLERRLPGEILTFEPWISPTGIGFSARF
jgi:tetratricopeptide (TPR) repeat protein